MSAILTVAFLLAFDLPTYHLSVTHNGHRFISAEDLTRKECEARKLTFKKSDHAKCIFAIEERELA